MVQELRSLGAQVHLAHPGALRLIFQSKNKTDANDAERLSRLLWLRELPESYIPTEQEAQQRELVGTRELLVGMRVALGNRIQHVFAKLNRALPTRGNVYSGPSLKSLEQEAGTLCGEWGACVKDLVAALKAVQTQIRACETRLQQHAAEDPRCAWLDAIDGFAAVASVTLSSRAGPLERFPNRRSIASYFGLTPRVDSSADKRRLGAIDKRGPADVRKILVQLVHNLIRTRAAARRYFEHLSRSVKGPKVYVAMARRLLVGIRAAWARQEAFELEKCFRVAEGAQRREREKITVIRRRRPRQNGSDAPAAVR